mgnify:FL=1
MNDNVAHNDNSGEDSITVVVKGYRDGRIGFRGITGTGEAVPPGACAKVIISAGMIFDPNPGIHNALEAFAKCIEREYGPDKARAYLLAMIESHNAAAELLKPTAADIIDG